MGKGVKEYFKYCTLCGSKQYYTKGSSLKRAIEKNAICKDCFAEKNYEEMPVKWLARIKAQATYRKIKFNLTVEYVYELYVSQGKKCSLSGVDLFFHKNLKECNVSVDRIDSNKGYIKGNIQLVHKEINFSKWQLSQKRYIQLCKLVAEKHK